MSGLRPTRGIDGEGANCRYLKVDEAAAYLGLSRRWMYRESQHHGLPRYYFGGKLRFNVADLDNWAQQQRIS
ncbi:helix-turn-helix domain-containing protein [Streptomyces sp. NPDC127105]|uniref:helix-turn-helix domain-containing protein n=1 Tax=Streptomyces sp. NPDC127105 TaxID=3345359 RepID=UPI0036547999